MRCKCIVSEITSNSCHDCDRMFFPEFMELLNYSTDRFKAKYVIEEDEEKRELTNMPMV